MAAFLTPAEIAERWGRSPEHVQRLCASGQLGALKTGRRGWRISPEALAAYEAARTTGSVSRASSEGRKPERAPVRTAPPIGPLPDGYEPRFPEAWGLPAKTAASPAAGRGRSAERTRRGRVR
jgi:excisionase family DNA binding protein